MQHVISTLVDKQLPCAVPVFARQHWAVVHGVVLDAEPKAGSPCEIKALWLNSPECIVRDGHDDDDDCGSGSADSGSTYVTYDAWLASYFCTTDCAATAHQSRYVVVSSADEPKLSTPRQTEQVKRHRVGELLSLSRLRELAELAVEEHGLVATLRRWGRRLRERLLAGTPLIVQRLDLPGAHYALIPMLGDGSVHVLAVLDAHVGTLQSYHPWPVARGRPFPPIERLLDRWLKHPLVTGLRLFLKQPSLLRHPPPLVWMPCQQSWNPALPFWMLQTPQGTLYVRVDGEVFSSLTTGLLG